MAKLKVTVKMRWLEKYDLNGRGRRYISTISCHVTK